MTRAKDREQDGSVENGVTQGRNITPAEERARVLQARESVQDAIGKIIGGQPNDGQPSDRQPDAGNDADNGNKDGARKPVSPPLTRKGRIDGDGAD